MVTTKDLVAHLTVYHEKPSWAEDKAPHYGFDEELEKEFAAHNHLQRIKMLFSQTTIAFMAIFAQGLAAATPKLVNNPKDIGNTTAPATTCSAVRSACQSKADANQSQCASLAAGCCTAADYVCRTAAGANMATCSADKAACYADAGLPDPYAAAAAAANLKREVAVEVCETTRSTCLATVGASDPALCKTLVATCCDDERDVCADRPGVDTAICASEHAVCYAYFSLPIPV
ncbi:hypothetical protein Daus18300_011914 [Diaporthe australafricana]|uniref:Uncharacterized protein n=1 Tax=Diaporthe australafricana TaxID=127596 RepID=A0ABR3W4P9_9PEZI